MAGLRTAEPRYTVCSVYGMPEQVQLPAAASSSPDLQIGSRLDQGSALKECTHHCYACRLPSHAHQQNVPTLISLVSGHAQACLGQPQSSSFMSLSLQKLDPCEPPMRRQAHRAVTQGISERVATLLAASEPPSALGILEAAVGSCSVASAQALVAVRGFSAGCVDDGACRQYGAEEQVCWPWPRDCMQVFGLGGKGRRGLVVEMRYMCGVYTLRAAATCRAWVCRVCEGKSGNRSHCCQLHLGLGKLL